jgi:hypothetical protein
MTLASHLALPAKVLWKSPDEASDLKQRTARWKRAVSDQRTAEIARILCFAGNVTLKE